MFKKEIYRILPGKHGALHAWLSSLLQVNHNQVGSFIISASLKEQSPPIMLFSITSRFPRLKICTNIFHGNGLNGVEKTYLPFLLSRTKLSRSELFYHRTPLTNEISCLSRMEPEGVIEERGFLLQVGM